MVMYTPKVKIPLKTGFVQMGHIGEPVTRLQCTWLKWSLRFACVL